MKHEIEIEDLQLPGFTLEVEYADGEITLPADWQDMLIRHVMTHFPELLKKVTDKQSDLEFWNYPAKWKDEEAEWAAEDKGDAMCHEAKDMRGER